MKKTIIVACATVMLGLVGPVQRASAAQTAAQQEEQPTSVTLRGCLTKDAQSQRFMVADENSGRNVSFDAPAQLERYVNQTVEITGRVVTRNGEKTFQPRAVKSVASSCKAQPAK